MPIPHSGHSNPTATSPFEWTPATGCGLHREAECPATFSRCWRVSENCQHQKNPTRAARREVRRRSSFQIPQGPSRERSRRHHRRLRLPQEFAEQHVKMVNAVFTLDGVTPAVIGGRPQAALNVFTEADIFLLDFITESHGTLDALLIFLGGYIVEKPFENRERLFVGEGHDYIRRNIVRINVEHEVWENPEIQSLLQAGSGCVETFGGVFCFHGADGSELLGVVAEGLGAIFRGIDFLHPARMRDGNVIALEIVVDVGFPVAVNDVISALGKLQTFKLKTARLLRNLPEVRGKWFSLQIEI